MTWLWGVRFEGGNDMPALRSISSKISGRPIGALFGMTSMLASLALGATRSSPAPRLRGNEKTNAGATGFLPLRRALAGQAVATFILAIAFASLAAVAGSARAATPDEAMSWLAGRWSESNCAAAWMQFDRNGQGWTYRELAYENGRPFPATASADPSGAVTVTIMVPDGEYTYVNIFRNKDFFNAVEMFRSATIKGDPTAHTYMRCR